MVIEKILKQLTPERIKKEVATIQKVKLPLELQRWVKEYEKVGERDEFLWKWTYQAVQIVTFSIIAEKYRKSLEKAKFLTLMIFAVLLNDAVDKLQNRALLNGLLKVFSRENSVSLNNFSKEEKQYILLVKKLWNYTLSIIKKCPRYKEFEDIFNFDILQTLNAQRYDYLLVKNYQITNKIENWLYPPHAMGAMICSDLDLMCSPKFNIQELGRMREIFWQVQLLARIGNWISSWEREVLENDFTSGVFAYVVDSEIPTIGLEKQNKLDIIKKIKAGGIEKKLLKEWGKGYNEIKKISTRTRSVNTKEILPKLEKLLILELSAQKYK